MGCTDWQDAQMGSREIILGGGERESEASSLRLALSCQIYVRFNLCLGFSTSVLMQGTGLSDKQASASSVVT